MESIKEKFPSKCWDCKYGVRTWSIELEEKGYTGCYYILHNDFRLYDGYGNRNNDNRKIEDLFDFTDAEELSEGWITKRRPLDRREKVELGEGITFNLQPITKEIKHCDIYQEYK